MSIYLAVSFDMFLVFHQSFELYIFWSDSIWIRSTNLITPLPLSNINRFTHANIIKSLCWGISVISVCQYSKLENSIATGQIWAQNEQLVLAGVLLFFYSYLFNVFSHWTHTNGYKYRPCKLNNYFFWYKPYNSYGTIQHARLVFRFQRMQCFCATRIS